MPILIMADVGGCIEALNAVLAFAKAQKVTRMVSLGNLVGGAPDFQACVEAARGFELCLKGYEELWIGEYDEPFSPNDVLNFYKNNLVPRQVLILG